MDFSLLSRRLAHGAAASAVAAAAVLGAGSAVASADSGALTTVPQGVKAQDLPGAKVFQNTPASTQETVSFVLKVKNLSTLQSRVLSGTATPLSVSQFAAGYGQSAQTISALENYLQGFGLSTQAYANDLDVVATGRAGDFDKALDVKQSDYHVPAQAGRHGMRGIPAQTVHSATSDPSLPTSIAQNILGIFGLDNYNALSSQAAQVSSAIKGSGSGSSSCEQSTGLSSDCHLPSDFASSYGLSPLYDKGALGQGQTVGIVTFAALDTGAPQYFWKNVEGLSPSGRKVSVDNIDGGPGAPSDASGTGETDLDVEQSGGVAPGANIIVYQAPNSDAGQFDALFTAASQDIAGSVSESWGESETVIEAAIASGQEDPAFQQAFDEAFLELGAQGQASFVSSGDAGAYDASEDLGTTNLSVDNPGDSPYVTAAGGTTLPWSGTLTGSAGSATVDVTAERAWGWDYLWQPIATITGQSLASTAESQIGGDGGGFSQFEARPSYQRNVSGTSTYSAVPYLTPTDYQSVDGVNEPTAWDFDANPSVVTGSATGRAVPDLSTNADPYSGYMLYEPSAVPAGSPALEGGWGGTSFVAPELNGSAAVIDSDLGRRVGLWNPLMYGAATGKGSPFTPLNVRGRSNDNLYYTGTPGTVFNPATGLGTPNLAKLAAAFAAK